jgi:hypothetical protein
MLGCKIIEGRGRSKEVKEKGSKGVRSSEEGAAAQTHPRARKKGAKPHAV